jgi:Bardet-Biedl syndrome 1 protein
MERAGKLLFQSNYMTCMKAMNKNREELKSISFLLLCNENRELIIMEPSGVKIKTSIKLPSVGVFIETHGQFDIDGKIFIACRDGKVYVVKNGTLSSQVYDIESKPIGIAYIEKSIVVAGMNNVIGSYYGKGKKNYSIYMPCTITNIEKMIMKRTKSVNAILVALSNGEIRMYNDKYLITSIKTDDIVMGMRFGIFGREEGSLVINFKHGGLSVKMLQRQANLSVSTHKPGPSLKQDVPLKIKLFVEVSQREQEHCVDMHRLFQKDL